jgi:peptidyl-prolyl cis-trans isomerase B (cyclophilin B)
VQVSSKHEREYARKRHEKWLARQAQQRAARRRRAVIAGAVLALLVLVGAVVLVLSLNRGDGGDATASRQVPDPSAAEGRTWTATLDTTAGALTLELDGAAAPQAVASFVTLAQEGFFDDTSCHRLTTEGIFVLQCGDPTGTGQGGPGYTFGPIENAPVDDVYPAGTVAMARVGGDAASMGSQFFLVYADSTIPADAAGGYTIFGHITAGMDVLQAVADAGIAEGTGQTPATEVTIEGVELQ